MSYRLEVRPQVWNDIAVAAEWYDAREPGLGSNLRGLCKIESKMCKNSRCSQEFAMCAARCVGSSHVVFLTVLCIESKTILSLFSAIIHAAQHDRRWKERVAPV